MSTETMLLVGCGKMGGALLDGWLRTGTRPEDVVVVEPHRETAEALREEKGVHVVDAAESLRDDLAPKVILFAVKPQMMESVVPKFAPFTAPETVFLSIAAGTPFAFFESNLGAGAGVVRVMPNTPAAVGRGISVGIANENVNHDQRLMCQHLMEAVGTFHWIDDEALMDAVTGVSGSGPAYVFYMVEALTEAGVAAGLPETLARDLARATIAGAGELLHQSSELPETLRKNVTSPGGTTAAALEVLMAETGLSPLLTDAVAAAARRSRELAS